MNTPEIPTPEAGDTPGDKIPSFSPSARESASKGRERTAACSGDTLTPGDEISSQMLSFAARDRVVTADVAQGPDGGAEPLTWPAEPPSWWPEGAVYAPGMARRIGIPFTPPETEQQDQPGEPHADQPGGFVPRELRIAGLVTLPVTQSQAPAASVTAGVTAPIAPSICPTCLCRVPARLSDAERQRARRARQRERSKPVP